MQKKNKRGDLIAAIIGISTLLFVFVVFYSYSKAAYHQFINTTIDTYDDSLKEIGYQKKSNTFYYGDDLRLVINQHDNQLSIELRDRLQDYDWERYLNVYLKTIKLFVDFDSELFSKGIEYVINNGIESENSANINFSLSSYSISIYYYPKENLYISITFDKYRTTDFKHYYATGIVDQTFTYDKLVLEKIFEKDVPVEILKRMSENALQRIDNNSIDNRFEVDSMYGNIGSFNKSSLNISYSRYDDYYHYIELELTYNLKDYHDAVLEDLKLLDGLFNTNGVEYKDKIIDLIENPDTPYRVSEKSYYSEKYFYGTFTLDDNFRVSIDLYENRVIVTYQFKE